MFGCSEENAYLYLHLREEILSKKLFLDPQFGRQSVIDQFHLSKERVGTIFKQGSDHTAITDFGLTPTEYRTQYLSSQD